VGSVRAVTRRLLVVVAALAFAAPASGAGPSVDARAWLVENGDTGEVLAHAQDARKLPIASLTKLMTVELALRHLQPGDVVVVDPRAARVGESSADLEGGERLTVRDLLEAALIQSANDAADALGYRLGRGSMPRFVAMMNAEAQRLGLHDTHYARADGLDAAGGYSSARDVTRLARIVMRSPLVRSIVRERTAELPRGRVLHTWNDLLGVFPGVIGVKTGHTAAAGWGQVAAARGRGVTVYATILGSPSRGQRNADLERLLAYGLAQYRAVSLVRERHAYARVRVGYGKKPVALVARGPLVRVVRSGRSLTEIVTAPEVASLPVERGAVLGTVRFYEDGRLLGGRPLVAARSVSRPGLAGRVGWYAARTWHHVAGFFS
jgi:serine-type D-Ala-D-Ala carboxypeptidase (penicillin-binding protein 5/6)